MHSTVVTFQVLQIFQGSYQQQFVLFPGMSENILKLRAI